MTNEDARRETLSTCEFCGESIDGETTTEPFDGNDPISNYLNHIAKEHPAELER